MIKEKVCIKGAYTAGENKPYIFEDSNFSPVASCKVVELEDSKAYALPVYKMSEDWFIDGKTEAPKGIKDSIEPIDYLIQEVDELYKPVGEEHFFNCVKDPAYCELKSKNSEVLHVVNGSLFDGLSINTVFENDSVLLLQELRGFKIPKKLQKRVKNLVFWMNHHTCELIQQDRQTAVNELAELYGNLCSVKVCIAPKPERDEIEVTWFKRRQNIRQSEMKAPRLRSSTGRYPSSPEYLIYPNKEVLRIDYKGSKVETGIMNALFVDKIFQKEPRYTPEQTTVNGGIIPPKVDKNSLQCGYIIGYRNATGATILLPVSASILTQESKHVADGGRYSHDSLGILASAGMPLSVDNLPEVRRLILSSNHDHRGCGTGGNKPFPARIDRAFTKEALESAEFY